MTLGSNFAKAPLIALVAAFATSVPALADEPVLRFEVGTFDPLNEAAPIASGLVFAERPESGAWIIQFAGPTGVEETAALSSMGLEVHGYIPDYAYLVTGDRTNAENAMSLGGARWVGPYEPGFRLATRIGTLEFKNPERAESPNLRLFVRTFGEPQAVAQRLTSLGGVVLEVIENEYETAVVVEIAPDLVEDIAKEPLVRFVDEIPEAILHNNTTGWVVQSNVSGQTPIWAQGIDGTGEIVTLMDSGVDYNSCFFREDGNAPPGPTHRKIIDYSTFGGQEYDGCGTGHGTHVAGTIAGDQSYITGSTQHSGMAPGALLTVQDVGNDGFFDCLFGFVNVPSSLIGAFNASYDLGARIHSNSWGSSSNAYDNFAVNVDQFMWNNPDFLIVFANGNAGSGAGTVGSPATAKNLISVGATQQAPNQNTIAGYSSRGPASDGRIKPTMVAPGGDSNGYIVSANNHTGDPPSPTCATQGSPFAGTSMATPAIAGLAALTRQYFRDGFYPQGSAGGDALEPSAALVKAVLVAATTDAGSANAPNNNEGFGRALLDDALYFDGETRELRVEMESGISTGETRTFEYEVESSSEPLEIALVWTDSPASQGAGVALVNNLDLTVTAPGGQVYRGNVLSGGESQTGGSADSRNVEEIFRLNNPPVGTYTIEIDGTNVPVDTQPFALASNGAFANWPENPASTPELSGGVTGWQILSTDPNPFTMETTIALRAPESRGDVSVGIYDATGRKVRALWAGTVDPGVQHLTWQGRDDDNRRVTPGVYFVRVMAAGSVALSDKVVLVK